MSFVKIWIHLVFSTKDRFPFLSKEIRPDVINHIAENCRTKGIFLKAIDGYSDHIHCLISLGKDQNIANICRLIKGEASFWINNNAFCQGKFAWQDDYFAVSVSESQVDSVVQYIKNQDIHHKKKSFMDEVAEFLQKFGFSKDEL